MNKVLIMKENNMKTQTFKEDKSNGAEAKEWWPATGRSS